MRGAASGLDILNANFMGNHIDRFVKRRQWQK
jgi:hypothetical protein